MFGASSELAPNMFGARSELASIMEFGFKVSRSTRHKIGNFGDVLPSQSLCIVVKKLNLMQQKQTTQETNWSKLNQKNIQNAKHKQKAQKN